MPVEDARLYLDRYRLVFLLDLAPRCFSLVKCLSVRGDQTSQMILAEFGYVVILHRTPCTSRPLAMVNSWQTSFGSA